MSYVIGLDSGHGLYTAGKQTPDGIKEWTLNDKVRDKVVAFLSEYDVEFVFTDNDEGATDESLTYRVNKYLNAFVDSFASLHHNALKATWSGATGVEIYVDKNATEEDLRLAECIYKRLVEYTGLKGRGIKRANFTVINQNKVPAVLVEGGFMDGTNDYKYITSDEGQTAYAKAVADGFIEYANLKKKATSAVVAITTNPATVKEGDLVSIKDYAKYYNGKLVPSWVKSQKWYVSSVSGDRAVIDKNEKGTNSINSPINVSNLTVVGASANTPAPTPVVTERTIKKGDTVRVKKGAKDYNGKNLKSFVYNRNHQVKEVKGSRAVITFKGEIVAAVNIKDLSLV